MTVLTPPSVSEILEHSGLIPDSVDKESRSDIASLKRELAYMFLIAVMCIVFMWEESYRGHDILIGTLIKKYEWIDVWINSAYPRTSDWGHKLEQVKIESWRHNVDMQLNSCFFCCQQVAGKMKMQKSGSIINFGSIYGIVGPYFPIYEGIDMTTPAAYAAIKGGIINLTRYLATYLAPYNVRVNCISPGGIFDHQPETFVQAYNKRTPLGRMAAPGEIVGTAIYLASEASSYITGQNLLVDGGWTAW